MRIILLQPCKSLLRHVLGNVFYELEVNLAHFLLAQHPVSILVGCFHHHRGLLARDSERASCLFDGAREQF